MVAPGNREKDGHETYKGTYNMEQRSMLNTFKKAGHLGIPSVGALGGGQRNTNQTKDHCTPTFIGNHAYSTMCISMKQLDKMKYAHPP